MMIQESNDIKLMLENIIKMTNIIKDDFERNGEVHCQYIFEKLSRAKWDLDILVKMAKENLDKKS